MMAHIDLVTIVSFVASTFMVVGGVIPYLPQYNEIWRTGNTEGFSLYVCLTLLIANTLRILFWFGHPFELPLLLQSIVMITAMFAMVHLCTLVKSQTIIPSKSRRLLEPPSESETDLEKIQPEIVIIQRHKFSDFDSRYFWNWTNFSSYVQCMALFTCITGATTYVFLDHSVFIETLGFLALFCEAMLGLPQFYRNFQNMSTKGMSVTMVLMWTAGDLFKTMYFILKRAPQQFWLCGMIQVALDFCILTQVVYYRDTVI